MPKQDTTLDTVYRMRMTESQKQKLFSATAEFSGGTISTSKFWRDMLIAQTDMLHKIRSGEFTPAEFGARMEQIAQAYLEATLTGNVQIFVSELETVTVEPEQDEPEP